MRKEIKPLETLASNKSKSNSSQNLCTQKSETSISGIPPLPNKENISIASNSIHDNSAYGLVSDRYRQVCSKINKYYSTYHAPYQQVSKKKIGTRNNSTTDLHKAEESKSKLPYKYISKMKRSQQEINQLESEYYEIRNKHNSKKRETNTKFNIRSKVIESETRRASVNFKKKLNKNAMSSYNSIK